MAMLHSFAYEDAIATFKDLETQEPCRGMAYYGEAIVGSSSYEHWLVNTLAVSISRIAIENEHWGKQDDTGALRPHCT